MRRRNFFANLLAAGAAFVVAPKVAGAEAKPDFVPYYEQDGLRILAPRGSELRVELPTERWDPVAEARAEGYERGRAVEQARQKSRGLTFEAMQQDCVARGCALKRLSNGAPLHSDGHAHTAFARRAEIDDLARVDAWRRSLHVGA